jgi:hypothetical protein
MAVLNYTELAELERSTKIPQIWLLFAPDSVPLCQSWCSIQRFGTSCIYWGHYTYFPRLTVRN